jgi:hypothetical protein
MKKLPGLLLCLLLPLYGLLAQDSVVVNKDPRLDILSTKQAAINRLTARMTSSGKYKGYRLQVLSTRSRDQAFRVKAELLQKFPGQKTYALYQSPYFKIRLGNFLERADAERFRKTMLQSYPQGVFVVEDVIEYTPTDLDSGDDMQPE